MVRYSHHQLTTSEKLSPLDIAICYAALYACSVLRKMYVATMAEYFWWLHQIFDGHSITFVIFSYHFCLVCPKTNTHTYTLFQL